MEPAFVVNIDGAVVRDGAYLCIERGTDETHAAGIIGFPGGKLEADPAGEDPIAATARRELREEVGLTVTDVSYITSNTFVADDGTPCLNIVTRCAAEGEPTIAAPDEVAAIHWLTPEACRSHPAVPVYIEGYIDAIEAHRNREGGP